MTLTVSIIVPCYNEEATIRLLLDSIFAQSYPSELLEVIISDGLSKDGTRDRIAAFQSEHPDMRVRVVDNLTRTIPAGLNRAIKVARGDILIRLDAHSMPYADYVARCVQALEEGRGANVGGVWEVRPGAEDGMAAAIAVAATHPLGVGDAMYRLSPQAGPVDTVPFGAFRRALIEKIGEFDERLLSNEDYEFNTRIRQAGGIVWLDPEIRSVYFSRSTLGGLARQYWRYGFWKFKMLRRYPATLRWRQALPPLFAAGLALLAILGIWSEPARLALAAGLSLYLAVLLLVALLAAARQGNIGLIINLPLAIATMHLAWGFGFLWSLLSNPSHKDV